MDPTSVNSLSRTERYVDQIRLPDRVLSQGPAKAQAKHGGQFDGRQASNREGSPKDKLSRARDKLDSVVSRLRLVSTAIENEALTEEERIRLKNELETIHVELRQVPGSPQESRKRPADLRSAINIVSGMREAAEHRMNAPPNSGYSEGELAEGDGTSISLSA